MLNPNLISTIANSIYALIHKRINLERPLHQKMHAGLTFRIMRQLSAIIEENGPKINGNDIPAIRQQLINKIQGSQPAILPFLAINIQYMQDFDDYIITVDYPRPQ